MEGKIRIRRGRDTNRYLTIGRDDCGTVEPMQCGGWTYFPDIDRLGEMPEWAKSRAGPYRTQREVVAHLNHRRRIARREPGPGAHLKW